MYFFRKIQTLGEIFGAEKLSLLQIFVKRLIQKGITPDEI